QTERYGPTRFFDFASRNYRALWSGKHIYKKYGSAQQSVKVCILRGLLESDVFAREACPMATSHQNGQNPQVRYGNDAPGQPCRDPNWTSPGAWKPASNAGSHIPTATAPAGCMAATRPNPAEIGVCYRFLHRTRNTAARIQFDSPGDMISDP